MADGAALIEVRKMFGLVPVLFERMDEAGALEDSWPDIRQVVTQPDPLPRPVVDCLMVSQGVRCRLDYCFVHHSMALIGAGADKIAITELHHQLAVPPIVPDHERWSRVIRLTWLATGSGSYRRAAEHALERECTPEELARIKQVCHVAGIFRTHIERHEIHAADEPGVAMLPEEMRALIPEFVEFHTRLRTDDPSRPVCTTCASCQKVRATDQSWYPRDAATDILPADVLYSHGLCSDCAELYESAV